MRSVIHYETDYITTKYIAHDSGYVITRYGFSIYEPIANVQCYTNTYITAQLTLGTCTYAKRVY